jgi:hypothetical protein
MASQYLLGFSPGIFTFKMPVPPVPLKRKKAVSVSLTSRFGKLLTVGETERVAWGPQRNRGRTAKVPLGCRWAEGLNRINGKDVIP